MLPFAKGRPRRPRRLVETTPRLLTPPSAGRAREAVQVVLDGAPVTLTIVRQDRIHGQEAYWECGRCGKPRWHLYAIGGEIACRECLGLTYKVKTMRNTAALRARKIRRKLGAALDPMSPLPPRPCNVWAAAYYDKLVRELGVCEAALASKLRDMVER